MNLFSFLTKMDCTFTSCKTTTKDNYLICNFLFFEIVIVDDDYVVTIQSFDRRNKWLRAYCYDQCIRCFFFYIFRCDFHRSTDFHACISGKKCIGIGKLIHFSLEWKCLFAFQDSTKFCLFFTEDYLMTASCSSVCSIKTARATACYEDFFLCRCRLYFAAFDFTSDQRVDSTSSG